MHTHSHTHTKTQKRTQAHTQTKTQTYTQKQAQNAVHTWRFIVDRGRNCALLCLNHTRTSLCSLFSQPPQPGDDLASGHVLRQQLLVVIVEPQLPCATAHPGPHVARLGQSFSLRKKLTSAEFHEAQYMNLNSKASFWKRSVKKVFYQMF